MRMTLLPECQCPECKTPLNAATDTDGNESPREGDLSLCIRCGALLRFFACEHAALRVRRLTREEWHDLSLEVRTYLTRHRRQLTLYHLLMTDWRYQ